MIGIIDSYDCEVVIQLQPITIVISREDLDKFEEELRKLIDKYRL